MDGCSSWWPSSLSLYPRRLAQPFTCALLVSAEPSISWSMCHETKDANRGTNVIHGTVASKSTCNEYRTLHCDSNCTKTERFSCRILLPLGSHQTFTAATCTAAEMRPPTNLPVLVPVSHHDGTTLLGALLRTADTSTKSAKSLLPVLKQQLSHSTKRAPCLAVVQLTRGSNGETK